MRKSAERDGVNILELLPFSPEIVDNLDDFVVNGESVLK
jgi:hypothetical protein